MQIVFASETIASCIVREQYTFRLFFWIDVVATFSMALDVPLIVNSLVNNPDGPGSGAGRPTLERGTPNGFITRLRSIVKVTRILRLMRLVQLYSRYQVILPASLPFAWRFEGYICALVGWRLR